MNKYSYALLNFLFNTAKLAIHVTRRRAIIENNPNLHNNATAVFKNRIRSRILNEYAYYSNTQQSLKFTEIWCIKKVLASIHQNKLVFADIVLWVVLIGSVY